MADTESHSGKLLLLAEEFVERVREGEWPALSEYTARYPELADDIRELFPAMVMMENLAPGDESLVDKPPVPIEQPPLARLGDYRIVREIGRGGMGVVYEAEQVSLGRQVALKVLRAQAVVDKTCEERFEREARAAARLHHSNIVPVYGVGVHEHTHYYAMQYIPGFGLDDVLTELRQLWESEQSEEANPHANLTNEHVTGRGENGPVPATHVGQVARTLFWQRGPAGEVTELHKTPPALASPSARAETTGRMDGDQIPTVALLELSDTRLTLPGETELSGTASNKAAYWKSVARIGKQVADALDYAHNEGVLHRDIKPANLLLDNRANVWITDFGLAKSSGTKDLTQTGAVVGTLRYLAPESFAHQADARTDVYALGLTLYELLAFRPAFDENDSNKLLKQVMHGEPARLRSINPETPRDLETIVHKAIESEPLRRYQTAQALADDLQRFLEDRPIRARRITPAERFLRWCRHNPTIAALAVSLLLVFVASFCIVTWKWREAATNAVQLGRAEKTLAGQVKDLATAKDKLKKQVGEITQAQQNESQAKETAIKTRNQAQLREAKVLFRKGLDLAEKGAAVDGLHWMLESLKAAPKDATAFRRVLRINFFAWGGRLHQLHNVVTTPHILPVALHPDGKTFAAGNDDGTVQFWDSATCKPLSTPPLHHNKPIGSLAFSPDGKILAAGECYWDGRSHEVKKYLLHFWDLTTGRRLVTPVAYRTGIRSVHWQPNRNYILVRTVENKHDVWQLKDGRLTNKPFPIPGKIGKHGIWANRFGPHGRTLITSVIVGMEKQLWNWPKGSRIPWPITPRWLAFHPNGRLVLAEHRSRLAFYDPAKNEKLPTPFPYRSDRKFPFLDAGPANMVDGSAYKVHAAQFTADGRTVVTKCDDLTIRLWEPSADRLVDSLVLNSLVNGVHVTPDMANLYAVDNYKNLYRYRLAKPLSRAAKDPRWRKMAPLIHWPRRLAYSPDGKLVITPGQLPTGMDPGITTHDLTSPGDHNAMARLFDTSSGQPIGPPWRQRWNRVRVTAFSPDGKTVAIGNFQDEVLNGAITLWDVATGKQKGPPLPHLNYISALAFSPDGKWLAAGDYQHFVKLWSLTAKRPTAIVLPHANVVYRLAFSADGKRLAVGVVEGTVLVWDVAKRRVLGKHPGIGKVTHLAFHPDGSTLLIGALSAQLWDVNANKNITERLHHKRFLSCLAYSPTGETFLTGTRSGTAYLWDGNTGKPLGTLPWNSGVRTIAYSPDGQSAVLGYHDGSARLWNLATRLPLGPPVVGRYGIVGVTFRSDGRSFVTTGMDGQTRAWPVPTPCSDDVNLLELWLQVRTGLRVMTGDTIVPLSAEEWHVLNNRLTQQQGDKPAPLVAEISDEQWHEARALDAEQDRDTFGAQWHLDRLIKQRPGQWRLYARRAATWSAEEQFAKASQDYKKATKLCGRETLHNWYRHRSLTASSRGQTTVALWYVKRLLDAHPEDLTLYQDRAALFGKMGDKKKRLADMRHMLKKGDNLQWLFVSAASALRKNHYDQAIAHFEDAVTLAPRSPNLCNNLAWLIVTSPNKKHHDPQRAIQLVKTALAQKGNRQFYTTLGVAHYRAGNYDAAATALRTSIKMAGSLDAVNGFFLAMTLSRQGHDKQATDLFDRAVTWMEKRQRGNRELIRFRREADAVLKSATTDGHG